MNEETKSIIRSLVASTPLKSTVRTLLKDYYDTVGFDLPVKELGFVNPEQYLRSIPDVVQIVGHGPYAEVRQVHSQKLDHINQLVSKQRLPKTIVNRGKTIPRSRVAGTYYAPPHNYPPPLLSLPIQPPQFLHHNANRNEFPLIPVNIPRQPPHSYQHINRKPGNRKPQQYKSHSNKIPSVAPATPSSNRSLFKAQHTSTPIETESIPPRLETKHVSPPVKTEESETVHQVDISPYIKKYMQKQLLSVEDEDSTFYDEVEERVPEEVKNNLRNLIGDHPEGIWCCDLPKLYRSRYIVDLDYSLYKFRTLNEMCLYLASIFHYIRPNKGDFKLYDKRKPIPHDLSVDMCMQGEIDQVSTLKVADDLGIPNIESLAFSDEPSNVVQYLEDIPRQWLSKEQIEGSYIDVSIAEIYDPSKFWFIIYKDKLDAMMDEMQIYYAANKHQLEIPPNKLKEGLYCCPVFMEEYHRAIIIAKSLTPKEDKIKVYFIDYGTVSKVPIKGICYLHQNFMTLPQQAIRGRLAAVYPPGMQEQWSREVSDRFFKLVATKELVARIEKINVQKQLVHLLLIEPKGSKDHDVYINNVLVSEGYAVSLPEEQKEYEINKYAVPIVRHLHFYPLFDELEQGLVPSAPEMITLLNNGCSLESIYPHYFRRYYYKHELEKVRTELSSEESESVEAKSTASSTADDSKSLSPEDTVNFTEDPIPDKGGTTITGVTSVGLPSLKKTSIYQTNPQQRAQNLNMEEGGVKSRTVVAVKPPPGFESVQPTINVQQTFMVPSPNFGYYPPVVQQNFFFPAYNVSYGGYSSQIPYNYIMMPPPPIPQVPPRPQQMNLIVDEYLNFLRNDEAVNTYSSEASGNVNSCSESGTDSDIIRKSLEEIEFAKNIEQEKETKTSICKNSKACVVSETDKEVSEKENKHTRRKKKKKKEKVQNRKTEKNKNKIVGMHTEDVKMALEINAGNCVQTEIAAQTIDNSVVCRAEDIAISEEVNDNVITCVENVTAQIESETKKQELVLNNNVCLLDTNEEQLDTILSRPGSANENRFVDSDALQTFLSDVSEKLITHTLLETKKTKSKYIEKKAISGKTVNVVTWEQKRYFVFSDALKAYTNLQLSITTIKKLLARRKIFLKDLNVDILDKDLREEFIRNDLVTTSKFGKFVHLVEFEQLPDCVKTFIPEIDLNIMDIL